MRTFQKKSDPGTNGLLRPLGGLRWAFVILWAIHVPPESLARDGGLQAEEAAPAPFEEAVLARITIHGDFAIHRETIPSADYPFRIQQVMRAPLGASGRILLSVSPNASYERMAWLLDMCSETRALELGLLLRISGTAPRPVPAKVSSGLPPAGRELLVSLLADGQIHVGESLVSSVQLLEQMKEWHQLTPPGRLTLHPDAGLVYEDLQRVLEQAALAGFAEVTFVWGRKELESLAPYLQKRAEVSLLAVPGKP